MSTKPATIVSAKIARRALVTSEYLARVRTERDAGRLHARDVDRAFQGAYLEFYVLLEEQLEYLFFGLLMGRLSATGVHPKVVVKSERTAKDLVLGGRPYADWLPIQSTIERADTYFRRGAPFSRLDRGERGTFSEMKVIRDAIAHSGAHASNRFRSQIIAGRALPPREKAPASYLAGIHSASRTRMDELIARASVAFLTLCS